MNLRRSVACFGLAAWMAYAGPLRADASADARAFVERENTHLAALLRQPSSAARDAMIHAVLDGLVDYEEVARRAFLGAGINDAQRLEVRDLLKRVVERRYRQGLAKALDCDLSYKVPRASSAGVWNVRIEVQPRSSQRAQPVRIDYVVRGAAGAFKVIDVLTEGASFTQSLHDEFERILTTPEQGYPQLLKTLRAGAGGSAR